MESIAGKTAIVTGASRGLGRAIAQQLASSGGRIVGLARNEVQLQTLASETDGAIRPVSGDITDAGLAAQLVAEWSPDLVVLCAGVNGPNKTIDQMSWEEFSTTWNTDVRGTLAWGQACLNQPLQPGSEVVIVSSGAAIGGSPISGGYAGAKRTQWFMANYFQGVSDANELGIRFRVILPKRIVGETDLGHAAAAGYAARQGVTIEQFLAGFGTPMGPSEFARYFEQALTDDTFGQARAIAIAGDGPTVLEA